MTISSIRTEGVLVSDEDTIRLIAERSIDGMYLFLFPRANLVLFPKNDIVQKTLKSDLRIKNVSVTRDGNELVVSIT